MPSTPVFASGLLIAVLLAMPTAAQPLGGPANQPSGLQMALAMEQVLTDAIAKAERSVVAIARGRAGDKSRLADPDYVPGEYATGIVIDRNGSILTNYHVLGDDPAASSFVVWHKQRPYMVTRIKAADPFNDLALLEIEGSNLEPLALGDADELKKGQIVISLGNPYAIARDGEVSATWGIISNLARKPAAPTTDPQGEASARNELLHRYGTLIETDARLNRGTSGGALINLRGELVGVTTSRDIRPGFEAAAGYALPVNDTFRRAVENLKQGRTNEVGFLGVAPASLPEKERRLGEHGVVVRNKVRGTPADKFGLRDGDVITHIGGQPLYKVDDLMREIGRRSADDVVQLTVRRDQRVFNQAVELSKKFVTTSHPAIVTEPQPNWRGLKVDYATALPRLTEFWGDLVDPEGCVAVTEVATGSKAWQAGVRPGAFISHVEGRRVAKPRDFFAAVEAAEGSVALTVTAETTGRRVRTVQP